MDYLKLGLLFKEPQCLIHTNDEGQLVINENILQEISSIQGHLVVTSIVGKYRTGKSYLMNRLAGKSSGFALGSTVESKTKGIWCLGVPMIRGSNAYLLIIDTEGLGDVKKGDATHDTWIFCLATLLSSVLVFNVMGTLDEDIVSKMNFITEMSKHMCVKQDGKGGDDDFDKYFPDLIVAIRDFCLELKSDGKELTADEYLEKSLSLRKGTDERTISYNNPRRCIRRYFPNRRCFTFDRPGGREKLLRLGKLDLSELSEDFAEETTNFCRHIYLNGKVKQLQTGKAIIGPMWVELLKTYVNAIRSGAIPCIENAVVTMTQLENEKACSMAVDAYIDHIEKVLIPTNEETLRKSHEEAHTRSIDVFLNKAIITNDDNFHLKLNETIDAKFRLVMALNEASSVEQWKKSLNRFDCSMTHKFKNGAYAKPGGYEIFSADLEAIKVKYEKQIGVGVKKQSVLLGYISDKMKLGQLILIADHQISEERKQKELERQIALKAKTRYEAIKQIIVKFQADAQEEKEVLMAYMARIMKKGEIDLMKMRKHQETLLTSRLKEQYRLLQEGFIKESKAQKKAIRMQLDEFRIETKNTLRRRFDAHTLRLNTMYDKKIRELNQITEAKIYGLRQQAKEKLEEQLNAERQKGISAMTKNRRIAAAKYEAEMTKLDEHISRLSRHLVLDMP